VARGQSADQDDHLVVGQLGIDDLDDLRQARLEAAGIDELLETATEGVLVFAAEKDGWPQGVVVSFVRADGSLWLTAVEGRGHARALMRDRRATFVVSSSGTHLSGRRMVSLRCEAEVHPDAETRRRILPLLAARLAPADPEAMIRLLDTSGRIVIELAHPRAVVSHDSRRIPGDGRGGDRHQRVEPGLSGEI
jgi:nitroimidazol reductase NimA-like FMN-containing flavoprotein (pyridoxamine 5'-phosphate oxidase superfamily)